MTPTFVTAWYATPTSRTHAERIHDSEAAAQAHARQLVACGVERVTVFERPVETSAAGGRKEEEADA